jgi:hypothetical protein
MSADVFSKNDLRLAFDDATHTYSLGPLTLTSVTQVLAMTGLARFDAPWFSDAVKARGTYLHEAIAIDVEGDLDDDKRESHLMKQSAIRVILAARQSGELT